MVLGDSRLSLNMALHQFLDQDFSIRLPSGTTSVTRESMQRYLPRAAEMMRSRSILGDLLDSESFVEHINRSNLIQFTPTTYQELDTAMTYVFDAMSQDPTGREQQATIVLQERLSTKFDQDKFRLGQNHFTASASRFPSSLALFEALAAISHAFDSRRIASVLHAFFVKNSRAIACDDERCIHRWGAAILVARMLDENQVSCLREIHNANPEIVHRRASGFGDFSVGGAGDLEAEFANMLLQVAIQAEGAARDIAMERNMGLGLGLRNSLIRPVNGGNSRSPFWRPRARITQNPRSSLQRRRSVGSPLQMTLPLATRALLGGGGGVGVGGGMGRQGMMNQFLVEGQEELSERVGQLEGFLAEGGSPGWETEWEVLGVGI
ncbi:hypothetical protein K402DRAFT_7723 [Aulographum hederae CBS 113979]|uniref:Uncharacterized protein n=1 Tax=Aulographum hederae CBS 113979 TaxID=1176131 RepID=A0A6G1HHJ7_9PEZI|nr:hypothetical protein K402DRAFT_7723 [Aulographum hederae CBS 113979]